MSAAWGANVLATRRPTLLLRFPAPCQKRSADRNTAGGSSHAPPRKTRPRQLSASCALPSLGASAYGK